MRLDSIVASACLALAVAMPAALLFGLDGTLRYEPAPVLPPPLPVAVAASVEELPAATGPDEDESDAALPSYEMPEGGTLTPSRATPVQVRSRIASLGPARWRVALQIVNGGLEVAQGRVRVVASVLLGSGRVVRVDSAPQSFKARRFTLKTVDLALLGNARDARLVGLEVRLEGERGVVVYTPPARHDTAH